MIARLASEALIWQGGTVNGWHETVERWIDRGAESDAAWIPILADALMLLVVLVVAVGIYFIALRLVVRLIRAVVKRTENTWDDELVHSRVFRWIAQLVPGMVLWAGGQAALRDPGADPRRGLHHCGGPSGAELGSQRV